MLAAGKSAPRWELNTTDGQKYSLTEGLTKGLVLLAFFKIDCPICQYTFPFLERIYQQLKPQGVQIWGISQDDEHATQRFAQEGGLTFPLLIDEYPYEVSRDYRLEHVPTIFLLGSKGEIQLACEGFCKADLLAIQKTLARVHVAAPPNLFRPDEQIPEYRPG